MSNGHTPDYHDIAALLDVQQIDSDGETIVYEGHSSDQPYHRVYGGQVVGQALRAAGLTVPDGRPAHSLHCYFLRPGKLDQRLIFEVTVLRDGGSFSARRIQVSQDDGEPILSMIASFQQPGTGPQYSHDMPDVPDPESLPSTRDLMQGIDHPVAHYWAHHRPVDIRHVDEPLYFSNPQEASTRHTVWMRVMTPLPADDMVHRSALAYASDFTLVESLLRRHGVGWTVPGLKAASLDHAMWFHAPAKADEWFLAVQDAPAMGSGRGLTRADYFSRDGRHIASTSQELMLRMKP